MNRSLKLLWAGLLGVVFLGCQRPCTTASDCDDGLYCNGLEQCGADQKCTAGTPPSCDDGRACTTDSCSEERRLCEHLAPDADRDGLRDATCTDARGEPLGNDCDDADPLRFPGNVERCDDVDNDCDPRTIGEVDVDGDGYVSMACSNPRADGGVLRGLDCNDAEASVHPGQAEQCNGADDDCDAMVDEGVTSLRYLDADNDGWGAGQPAMGCVTPGTSHLGTDCDDTNPALHPMEFRCVSGLQGTEYDLCQLDGGWTRGRCTSACRPQPNNTGVCL